jgi:hypothetical protein
LLGEPVDEEWEAQQRFPSGQIPPPSSSLQACHAFVTEKKSQKNEKKKKRFAVLLHTDPKCEKLAPQGHGSFLFLLILPS